MPTYDQRTQQQFRKSNVNFTGNNMQNNGQKFNVGNYMSMVSTTYFLNGLL